MIKVDLVLRDVALVNLTKPASAGENTVSLKTTLLAENVAPVKSTSIAENVAPSKLT
jgi:hypothetical protein